MRNFGPYISLGKNSKADHDFCLKPKHFGCSFGVPTETLNYYYEAFYLWLTWKTNM